MARTLDPTLDASQDSKRRKPIMSLISSDWGDDIPFIGNQFDPTPNNQQDPAKILHSNGAFYCIFREYDEGESAETECRHLRVYYTDTEKSTWQEKTIKSFSDIGADSFKHGTLVELQNGNIGIVTIWRDASLDDLILSYMIIDEDCEIVTDLTQIENIGDDDDIWAGSPTCVYTTSGEYYLAYAYSGELSKQIKTSRSQNFTSWSTPGELQIQGIHDRVYNVSLLELENNDVVMWMDHVDQRDDAGVELKNSYMATSSDYGYTWTSGEKVTDYTEMTQSGIHPMAVQKQANQMTMVYTQDSSVLLMDKDTTGWHQDPGAFCQQTSIAQVRYDSVNDKLYAWNIYSYAGTKVLCTCVVIDVPTWTIDKYYDTSSIPSFNDIFANTDVWYSCHRIDPPFFAFANVMVGGYQACVIDHSTETVRHYAFADNATYSIDRNVDIVPGDGMNANYKIRDTWFDADNRTFWIMFIKDYYYDSRILIGYFDYDEPFDPGTGYYPFHILVEDTDISQFSIAEPEVHMVVDYTNGYIYVTACTGISSWEGFLAIYTIATGALYKKYKYSDYSGFHMRGVYRVVEKDGYLYGGINYESAYGQVDRRGIMKIDYVNDIFTYHRPSTFSTDDYNIQQIVDMGNGELLCASWNTSGGVLIYDVAADSWEMFNTDNVEGFDPGGYDKNEIWTVDYDSDNGVIFTGRRYNPPYTWDGIMMFSRYGLFKQPYYMVGTYTTSWSWTDPALMVRGLYNGQLTPTLDEQNSIWGVWRTGYSLDEGVYLEWDREGAIFECADLVPNGSEVAIQWNIDSPNELKFSLAKAWLFDPNNLLSIYATYVKKGRKVTVKFGETINDIAYWENQGQFVITEIRLSYARGLDPVAEVTCYDRTYLWTEMLILATPYYENDPRTILLDLMSDYMGLAESDTVIPDPMTNSHEINHQFIEENLWDIVTQILDHFQYVPYYDHDGKFSVRYITKEGSITNTYTDNTTLINFTPDDTYSSFVNRVEVVGESDDFFEVVYPEEAILSDQGTIGWWGENKEKTYYYSDDHNRRCQQPRLHVIEDPEAFSLFISGGGGSIDIVDEDADGYYVVVEIDGPNLVPALVAYTASLVALIAICYECDAGASLVSWCGLCLALIVTLLNLIINILATEAHWSFEIYAQPLGEEKQTIQGVAEDEDLQQELGDIVVTEKLEDPFCYTVSECERVAEYELSIVQGQRNRLMFTKIAHLQDEICDTIQIPHPYTGQSLNCFIVSLRRRYQKPKLDGGEGHFFDDIEGWRVTGS